MAGGMSPRASLRVGAMAGIWSRNRQQHDFPEDEKIRRAQHRLPAGGRPLPAAPICLVGKGVAHGKPWRPSTYPSHVADAEYPVDDVLVDVCGHELHLDGPVAPGGLLRPVLHAELGRKAQGEPRTGVGRALVSLVSEPLLLSAEHAG